MKAGSALWSAQAHMPTVLGRQIVIAEGDGCYVTTVDGQRLLDATAGLWHANVGHGREELARAAYDQMRKLETYHVFNRFVNEAALELTARLAKLSPIPDPKIILGSGGSEAVETACKLARRHWQLNGRADKKIILSRRFAYHGIHAFGSSIAGIQVNREGYGSPSLVPETAIVDHLDIRAMERAIEGLGPENIAAVIAEPVMGTGGVFPPPARYLSSLRALTSEHDILLIADEVITGFGRTGQMFACDRYKLVPDLMLVAKGITSGYLPLGGVLASPRIWETFYGDATVPVSRHGTTYSGHATACAVALAHFDILENESLVERVNVLEPVLDSALGLLRANPLVTDVRMVGLLAGIELDPSVDAQQIADQAVDAGVILRALRGNTLQVSPPFIITGEEISYLVSVIDKILKGSGSLW